MEEDLVVLGLKIKRDPETYRGEYSAQLRVLRALISLPSPPIKRIKPMISFLVRHCSVDPSKSVGLLADALDTVSDHKTKRAILNGLVVVRQKKYIGSKELLRMMIIHGNDLKCFLSSAQEFLCTDCYGILVEWFRKGTERQKCFCYYLLLVLFSKIHDVSDRKRMAKMQEDQGIWSSVDSTVEDSQRSDELSDSDAEWTQDEGDSDALESCKRPYDAARDEAMFGNGMSTVDMDELEQLISDAFYGASRISKICCMYFLNRTEVKFDISKLKRGQEYCRKIHRELSESVTDRDMKLMKLRIFVLFKRYFKVRQSAVRIILEMIDLEKSDLRDLLDCLVRSVDRSEIRDVLKTVSEEFVREGQDNDVVVYGMNVMREIYTRFAEMRDDNEYGDFLEEIKNLVLRYIECFRGNRTRPIFFAYRMVLKALRNEVVDKPVDHVKKKATREERAAMRQRGKEEARRLREESRREEKHERYGKRKKGRKKTVMLKRMLRSKPKKS